MNESCEGKCPIVKRLEGLEAELAKQAEEIASLKKAPKGSFSPKLARVVEAIGFLTRIVLQGSGLPVDRQEYIRKRIEHLLDLSSLPE